MNVITLNNDQLAHVRSTLQKQANALMGDMNAAGESNWSELLTDLANDQHDLIRSIIAELDDCQTPKVVKPSTIPPNWLPTSDAAETLAVDSKKLHNLKQTGRLKNRAGCLYYRKEGRNLFWNIAALDQFFSENSSVLF